MVIKRCSFRNENTSNILELSKLVGLVICCILILTQLESGEPCIVIQ